MARIFTLLLAIALVTAGDSADAADREAFAPFMQVGDETSQPIGHYQFCRTLPGECDIHSRDTGGVVLTEPLWQQLLQVDGLVNSAIVPATDEEIFGEAEVWFYPATTGDCEDYVLLKRRLLADAGWPLSALLITVVRKADGEGHAVLTVRTDRGDFILDNLDPTIRLWSNTPYQYVKRQSDTDTGIWVSIRDGRDTEVAVVGDER